MSQGNRSIDTRGGAYIPGDLEIHGGDFVGRDKILYLSATATPVHYRSEIAGLLDWYTKTFVGRKEEGSRLADWARQEAPGYLLIEAPSGYGKSAFIAHLVHKHETGRWDCSPVPTLLYFFIRHEGNRNTPNAFLQALNSQLLEALRQKGDLPLHVTSLHNQFNQLWTQAVAAASHKKPLLLLVDGLDEMAEGEATIADELPTLLTSYVHVVVTSRPNPEPLARVPSEHPFKQASVLRLQTLGSSEMQALLQENGLAPELAAKLSSRVTKVTKGEPLFARFVCQAVGLEGESALKGLEQNPPADVEAYFRQQFRQLDKLAGGEHTWDVLGLLVVALGGMKLEEIAEALEVDRQQARKAVEPIMRFLLGETRLELMHLQLRKIAAEELGAQKQAAYRQRLLKWCRGYEARGWPKEVPDYVLVNYARHLAEGEQKQALYGLMDWRWMNIKFERTHSYRAFADDVSLGIEAAGTEESTDWVHLARGCLIHATLASLAAGIPFGLLSVLVQVGQLSKALGYASMMQAAPSRGTAYCVIGEALVAGGDMEKAAEILEEALVAAEGIAEGDVKANLLCNVAQILAQAGSQPRAAEVARQALAVARTIENQGDREGELAHAAQVLSQAGEFALALEAVGLVETDLSQWRTMGQIAPAFAQAGQLELLVSYPASFENGPNRQWALSEIAQALARAGRLDWALEAARAEGEGTYRASVQGDIVKALAGEGMFEQALEAVQTIGEDIETGPERKTIRFLGLRIPGPRKRRRRRVLGVSFEWSDILRAAHQPAALEDVVQALSGVQHKGLVDVVVTQSLAIAQTFEGDHTRVEAWKLIGQGLVQGGHKDQAGAVANHMLTEAQKISSERSKAAALAQAARLLSRIGQRTQAAQVAGQALAMAESITDESSKCDVFNAGAEVLAAAGMPDQALAVAEKIEGELNRLATWCDMAGALAQAGQNVLAVQLAEQALAMALATGESVTEDQKAQALRIVTHLALMPAGMYDAALQTVGKIEDQAEKKKALGDVACGLARRGESARSLDAVKLTGDSWKARETIRVVAIILAQQGMYEQAIAAAKEIEYFADRAKALRAVAMAAVQAGKPDLAWQAVEAIDSGYERASAIPSIAWRLAQTVPAERAPEVIDRALAVAEMIKGAGPRATAKSDLAQVLIQMEHRDRAAAIVEQVLKDAETIEAGKGMPEALQAMAGALAQAGEALALNGEHERAVAIADQVFIIARTAGDPDRAGAAWAGIARCLAQAGALEQARLLAERTGGEWQKAEIVAGIAHGLAVAGKQDQSLAAANQAMATLNAIDGTKPNVGVLIPVACSLARAGMYERGLDATKMITEEADRARALGEIAHRLASTGGGEQALAIARTIPEDEDRAKALGEIAHSLASTGAEEQALVVAKEARAAADGVDSPEVRVQVYAKIARLLAQSDTLEQALSTARMVEKAEDRAAALMAIAHDLVEAGDTRQVLELSNETLDLVKAIEDPFSGGGILGQVSLVMARAGIESDVVTLATRIKQGEFFQGETYQAWALESFCSALAHAGKPKQALVVARLVAPVSRQKEALSRLAGALLVEAGEVMTRSRADALELVEQALAIAQDLGSAERVTIGSRGAQTLARLRYQERALALLRTVLMAAYLRGREPLSQVLEDGAFPLASIDQGKTLWRVCETIMDVERWSYSG